MCHNLTINNDAIFIADSHIQQHSGKLLQALNCIKDITSQIFLLGDISNILVGNIKSSIEANKELIDLINKISHKTQIIYFEGNHDFHLTQILPHATIITRKEQPQICKYNNKNILLAHGDIFLNKQYEYYIAALTSPKMAKILQFFDTISAGNIYQLIHKKVQNKKISVPYNVDSIVQKRILAYKQYIKSLHIHIDMVIEGHFHIGKITQSEDFTYIALPSFYYDEKVFKLQSNCFLGITI